MRTRWQVFLIPAPIYLVIKFTSGKLPENHLKIQYFIWVTTKKNPKLIWRYIRTAAYRTPTGLSCTPPNWSLCFTKYPLCWFIMNHLLFFKGQYDFWDALRVTTVDFLCMFTVRKYDNIRVRITGRYWDEKTAI